MESSTPTFSNGVVTPRAEDRPNCNTSPSCVLPCFRFFLRGSQKPSRRTNLYNLEKNVATCDKEKLLSFNLCTRAEASMLFEHNMNLTLVTILLRSLSPHRYLFLHVQRTVFLKLPGAIRRGRRPHFPPLFPLLRSLFDLTLQKPPVFLVSAVPRATRDRFLDVLGIAREQEALSAKAADQTGHFLLDRTVEPPSSSAAVSSSILNEDW